MMEFSLKRVVRQKSVNLQKVDSTNEFSWECSEIFRKAISKNIPGWLVLFCSSSGFKKSLQILKC